MEANRGNTTSKSFALASLGVSTLIFALCLTKLRSPDSVISQIGFGYSVFFPNYWLAICSRSKKPRYQP